MRKAIDCGIVILCLLTIADTDYANFGLMDGIVFASMGIALLSYVGVLIVRNKKGGEYGGGQE